MKLFFVLILSFLSITVFTQNNNDFFQDTLKRFNISSTLDFNYGSNVTSGEFLNKFIFGGKIEQDLKNEAFGRLSNKNRLGGDYNQNFNVEIPIDTFLNRTDILFVLRVAQREHLDAGFNKELFQLTFGGNKQFAGEQIDIGDFNFNYYKYQEVQFGFISHKKKHHRIAKKGIQFSVIKGESFTTTEVPRGSLYTEEFGREVELDLNYIYNESDTTNQGISAFNGIGASADLLFEFFTKKGDKIHIGVEDIGFINWNNKTIRNETDSTFDYDGVLVNNIFDLNDSLLTNISVDTIIDRVSSTNEKRKHTFSLPTAINLNYTKYFNQKLKINAGVYYKILSNYFPLIYTNTYYYFNPSIALKAHISYGGYGKLNTGLALAASIKNSATLFLGSNNIEALISPNSSYTNSGYLGIKVYF